MASVLPLGCNRVKLVEEQDTWPSSTSPLKEIANRGFTCSNVLVEQFWALHANEVEPAFLCNSRSEERLAASRVPVKE